MTENASRTDAAPTYRFPKLRLLLSVSAVMVGLGMVLVVAALGHCSAFGGSCPADPKPLLEDDVFGTAAFGAALAFGLPTWLAQPTISRLKLAAPVAFTAALAVGLVARSSAAG